MVGFRIFRNIATYENIFFIIISVKVSHTDARARTHTHTQSDIYIYKTENVEGKNKYNSAVPDSISVQQHLHNVK